MRRVAIVAAFTVVLASIALAQQPTGTSGGMKSGHIMFVPSEARWSPAPPNLPAGAEMTVIEGDPSQPALFTVQIKMPDGYKVAPHWHPTDERQTVVKGSLMMGMGNKWNDGDMKELTPGGFVMLPKENPHYVQAKGETILQIEAMGPYGMTYINPSDDPSKK